MKLTPYLHKNINFRVAFRNTDAEHEKQKTKLLYDLQNLMKPKPEEL